MRVTLKYLIYCIFICLGEEGKRDRIENFRDVVAADNLAVLPVGTSVLLGGCDEGCRNI